MIKSHNFIDNIFSSVSSRYDFMNDIMSLTLHRKWKKRFLTYFPDKSKKLLDVASGTGDIALSYYKESKLLGTPDVTMCDPNSTQT